MRAVLGGEPVSPPIGEATPDAALQDGGGALAVAHVAGVVAQIELGAVTAQMRFAHLVKGGWGADYEDR